MPHKCQAKVKNVRKYIFDMYKYKYQNLGNNLFEVTNMNDEDMKIYVPKSGGIPHCENETDDVKIYSSVSDSAAEHSAHLP